MIVFEVQNGELAEGCKWELYRPYRSTVFGDLAKTYSPPCRHAVFTAEAVAKTRTDGSLYGYERAYEIPEAARCFNEAGRCFTVLCLLCADEARQAFQVSRGTPQ